MVKYDKQRGGSCCVVAFGAYDRVFAASTCVCMTVQSRCVPIGGASRVGTTCHTVVAPCARHACCQGATCMIWHERPSYGWSARVLCMASVGLLPVSGLRRTRGMLWMCLHTYPCLPCRRLWGHGCLCCGGCFCFSFPLVVWQLPVMSCKQAT